MTSGAEALVAELRARALALGFDAFGIAGARSRPDLPPKLAKALSLGWHGDMDWMAQTQSRRAAPVALWREAKSLVMLGMNYGPAENPLPLLDRRETGNISVYARNRDYHDVIKGKLKDLAGVLSRRTGADVKVFVDTAPLMEKPFAEAAGLGWQGKHSVLVSRQFGSWLFLGAILTSADLPSDAPHEETCGTCSRCLDICPTDAFPAPFRLDARKCLAYLNVEHKTQIPRRFRAPMGNRVFGCDDCLAVCPWNKFASQTREIKLRARADLEAPDLGALLGLDAAGFAKLFAGSPVRRLGHARFLRNVLIAVGNSHAPRLVPAVAARLSDPEPLIRGAAIWAYRRLAPSVRVAAARAAHLAEERDPQVAREWEGALTPPLSGVNP